MVIEEDSKMRTFFKNQKTIKIHNFVQEIFIFILKKQRRSLVDFYNANGVF